MTDKRCSCGMFYEYPAWRNFIYKYPSGWGADLWQACCPYCGNPLQKGNIDAPKGDS